MTDKNAEEAVLDETSLCRLSLSLLLKRAELPKAHGSARAGVLYFVTRVLTTISLYLNFPSESGSDFESVF